MRYLIFLNNLIIREIKMIGIMSGATREIRPVIIENTIITTPIIPKISNNFFHHLSIPKMWTFGPLVVFSDDLPLEISLSEES